ncbi:MAG: SO_0444 family Cu/Zn efflux transporter [Candidatus Hydrogenedentales bacterium]|jgi:uncharacterized membrane protein YraQ (UPF0718 family)/copper chaperone CopZ
MKEILLSVIEETVIVAGQMSLYLLFGFLVAGFLYILAPSTWIQRHLGGKGFIPVLKSVALGVPLPLCSCGVIPVMASIRKQGAGKGASTGFLIATPQTGVDSILATWGMLGPVMGIIRPLLALVTGLTGGILTTIFDREEESTATHEGEEETTASCCAVKPVADTVEKTSFLRSIPEAFRYGLETLPRDIARPLVVGIILAGMISALLPSGLLKPYIGGGFLSMVVMTVIGIPLYVCATASIPVALGFIHLGASPGAALAFLIAGPATNAAAIATVWKMLGRRVTYIYLFTVATGAIISGLFYDALVKQSWISSFAENHVHDHDMGLTWFNIAAAIVLGIVILNSVYGSRVRAFIFKSDAAESETASDEPAIELSITGMSCGFCANTVTDSLKSVSGVSGVDVDLQKGRAKIRGSVADPEKLVRAVEEVGYHALFVK